jgi:isoleucyl-tRNA synthetase
VLVHGFVLDEKGREMHKSYGNFVEVSEIVRKHGRDPFRLFMLSSTVWEDLKFSDKKIQESRKILNIVWNVYSFAKSYMEVDNYRYSKQNIERFKDALRIEDRWILSRFYKVLKYVREKLDGFRIHEAIDELTNFMVNDISHLYLRIIKRRVWVEENTDDKLAVYAVLFKILRDWIIAFSIATPYIGEYIYQSFIRKIDSNSKTTINLEEWPSHKEYEDFYDEKLDNAINILRDVYEALLSARMRAGIKIRRPVEKCIILTSNRDISESIAIAGDLVKELVNCKNIVVEDLDKRDSYTYIKVEPNLSMIGREFRKYATTIIDYINNNKSRVAEELEKQGFIEVSINGERFRIDNKHVSIVREFIPEYRFVEREWGFAGITLKVSEELIAMGIAREIVRRIQVMRKELNLQLLDEINVDIYIGEDELVDIVNKVRDYIANETRARSLQLVRDKSMVSGRELVREWDIDGVVFVIGISKHS